MARLFGALGLADTDRLFGNTIGQRLVYDATAQILERFNLDRQASLSLFVEQTTEAYKERYKLPGGGKLARRGVSTYPDTTKANGSWDVAYPLEDFGTSIAVDDVSMAYMSVQEYDRHVQSVLIQSANTVRFELLRALFNNTNRTFVDPQYGTLTCVPLANGDGTLYPPVLGSESEADDTHHLESGYLASAISDTNNPLVTIRDELEEHFGTPTGGSRIAVFCNTAQNAKLTALTDFAEVQYQYTTPGDDTARVDIPGIPAELMQGTWRVLGTSNGVIVCEWRHVPANYLLGVHLDAPKPLKMRVDEANTGLGSGLRLVARDQELPFERAFWRDRFGFGVANRLNGVVMELGNGGTYDIPSGYSW